MAFIKTGQGTSLGIININDEQPDKKKQVQVQSPAGQNEQKQD